jgi:uncharacterized peroxidase-related enzyme
MTDYPILTDESAPESTRPLLQRTRQAFGFVPNLAGVLANAPAALEGMLDLVHVFDKTSFTPLERQIVLIATSVENECHYCVAANSTLAAMAGASDAVLDAVRRGAPLADTRLEALRTFATAVTRTRGWVSEADVTAFLDAGFDGNQILEVILGVTLKTLTNYTNHVALTPVDTAFRSRVWSPRRAA